MNLTTPQKLSELQSINLEVKNIIEQIEKKFNYSRYKCEKDYCTLTIVGFFTLSDIDTACALYKKAGWGKVDSYQKGVDDVFHFNFYY